MGFYPDSINEICRSPANAGDVEGENASGSSAAFECGTFVRMSLHIDDEGKIMAAKYRTNACGFALAACEVLARWLADRNIKDLNGLRTEDIHAVLRERSIYSPATRRHCADVAVNAIKAALAYHRARVLEEFQGEKALICTCFGVSEESIESLITERGVTDVNEVSAATNAGTGCGSCRMLIQEILDSAGHQG